MRPGRGIGKQHLHIARAHIFGIHLIRAAHIAGDAAHNFQRILVVEPSRRQPVTIVQQQGHLGKVARRPGSRACKDHIFHAATPHGSGAVFPHHPAQRFQQVRFTAAIRAHHACQPLADQQFRRVDKAFKAGQSQFRKAQNGILILGTRKFCGPRLWRVNENTRYFGKSGQLSTRYWGFHRHNGALSLCQGRQALGTTQKGKPC